MNENATDIFIDLIDTNSFSGANASDIDNMTKCNKYLTNKKDIMITSSCKILNYFPARSLSMSKIQILAEPKIKSKNNARTSYPDLNIKLESHSKTFQKKKTPEIKSVSKPNPEPVDHLNPEFYLDLSLITHEGFDSDNDSLRMPPNLREMVTDPKGTPLYLALCGNDISGYNKMAIEDALYGLKYYQRECILHGFIQDSAYIEDIINTLIANSRELKKFDVPSLGEAEDQLDDAIIKFEKKETQWKNIDSQVDASEEVVLSELFLKYQNDLENLNTEWNSSSKLNQFNKPSNKLVELRISAKNLMKQHRFTESAQVFNLIAKQEKKEQEEAGRKMQQAYNLAQQKLKERYQRDVESKKLQFEKKRNAILMKKKASLMPLGNRVLKCEKNVNKRIEIEKKLQNKEKRSRANSSFGMVSESSANSTYGDCYYPSRAASRMTLRAPKNSNQKLKLPPINPSTKIPLSNLNSRSNSRVNSNLNSRPISSNKNILSKGKNTPHISRPDSRMAMRQSNLQNNMY